MSVLIIAEHDNHEIKDATLSTIAAGQKMGGDITVLVAGHNCAEAATKASQIDCVSKVLKADDLSLAHNIAENLAPMIANSVKVQGFTAVLAPGTTFGKNILPRVSALLDVQQLTDIIAVESADTFKRPIYGGQAIATVQTSDAIKIMTVRATAFDKVAAEGGPAPIEDLSGASNTGLSTFVGQELSVSERPELTSAGIVVSGGRGVGSEDDFKIIEGLADKLGAALGASRAAVDSGYISNDHQVGQTGKVVAPELYIAVGISGAIQHLAGMKDSKIIVAINKDEEAPIFQVADYGLVADLFEAVPELNDKLQPL
jgi:electron transfer flavoprotein alpha subunit